MINVLILCHGNVCRSPVFYELLKNKNISGLSLRQASLKSYNNDNWVPSRASKKIRVKANELFGISLEDHRSHKLTMEDIEWCNYCIYFDNGNFKRLSNIIDITEDDYRFINAGNLIGLKSIKDPNFLKSDSPEIEIILNQIKESVDEFVRRIL